MAQVLVRDLPEETVARLKERAAEAGRSLEAELRDILNLAAQPSLRAAEAGSARALRGSVRANPVPGNPVSRRRKT